MQNVAQESAGYFGQCRLERRGRLLLCVTSQMGIATLLVHVAKKCTRTYFSDITQLATRVQDPGHLTPSEALLGLL